MKKTSLFATASAIVLSFGFIACSPELPSALDPLGVTSSSSSGGGGGSGSGSSATVTTKNLTKSTVSTTASINESVTVDLSSSKLTAAAVASMPVGTDVTNLFTQNIIEGSSTSSSLISRNILRDTASSSSETSTDGYKVVVKSISEVSLEVTITTSNPGKNCSILYTAVIPAKDTQDGKAYVDVVRRVDVGTGAVTGNDDSISISSGSIPAATEVAGKIFQIDDNTSKRTKYYKFDSEGAKATKYRYNASSSTLSEKESYNYETSNGALKEVPEDGEESQSEIDSAIGDVDYLIKLSDKYYTYNGMKLTRKSGTGLSGTFEFSISVNETLKQTLEDETEMVMGTATGTVTVSLTLDGAGTFVGGYVANVGVKYSDEFKKFLTDNGASESDIEEMLKDSSESETSNMYGMYTNNGGVITARGSSVYVYTNAAGIKETQSEDFDNGIVLYSGNDLYFGDALKIVDKMLGE